MLWNSIKQIVLILIIASALIFIILALKGIFGNLVFDAPNAFIKAFWENLGKKLAGG